MNTENFIKKAKSIHGNEYDYSKTIYKGSHEKIIVTCKIHGDFLTTPANHTSKHNQCKCPKCSNRFMNKEYFIEKAKEIHGNKYDYSKVEYINTSTKVCIICPIHGEFWQRPNDHLNGRGCNKCGKESLREQFSNKKTFIEKAKKIHGNKYDYSKVNYINAKTKVCIICPEHGEFWQTPDSHLRGRGCQLCNSFKKSVDEISDFLQKNGIIFDREKNFEWLGKQRLDFYIPKYNIAIEYQGEQHFKPIKYFGGEKRFKDRTERDERKLKKCIENGVKILYITFVKNINKDNIIKTKEELLQKILENEY